MKFAALQGHMLVVQWIFRAFQGFRYLCHYGRFTKHIAVNIKIPGDTDLHSKVISFKVMLIESYHIHLRHISSLAVSQRRYIITNNTRICLTDENAGDVSTPLVGVTRMVGFKWFNH